MNALPRVRVFVFLAANFLTSFLVQAQTLGARRLHPNLIGQLAQPLRYRPDNGDFVIENGTEFFNRPLYGGHTAFRSDAGDLPEFTLYLPGRGGNLRLGVKSSAGLKWLQNAQDIIARYRPGTMLYEIRDPLLGPSGVLQLAVIALPTTDGLIVRVEAKGTAKGLELLWAFGGVNGVRGSRDGDIGTERVPIAQYFRLQPEYCRGNSFTLGTNIFTLSAKVATLFGVMPPDSKLAVGDARQWNSPSGLLSSANNITTPTLPVVVGRVALVADRPLFLSIQRLAEGATIVDADLPTYSEVTADRPGASRTAPQITLLPAFSVTDLPKVYADADAYFEALRARVSVDTPDPYLNSAVAALNVAADAVWDTQGDIMHGAIAWRTRLLGWRGPYMLDDLGWHDRARQHFTYWIGRQNTSPIPDRIPAPEEATNLARNEAGLHSNGDMSNSHYDMNLVAIDALFRHLRWTGDLEFAREVWPVIERHLAWERRLFRREYGPHNLPLYEAYAAIWASDDLYYGGGGTAHASAYNYFHNRMAAQLARLLGHDPAPYDHEADLIARAMRELLWLPDRGAFAEFKDLLGLQLVHPDAALWTYYHVIDSEVPTPAEAWAMTRAVDARVPHLPVYGRGVPSDADYAALSTSDWMPYSWSINNVVFGENVHMSLGYWQAGRNEEAYRVLKSALLASMYMGITPGDIGSMNYLDVYRRESQRDFADGGGVFSRALVEGLFGLHPDALAGTLRITPGFPAAWSFARLQHPDCSLSFQRTGYTDTYTVEPKFSRPLALHLGVAARYSRVTGVTVNGNPVRWRLVTDAPAARLEIDAPAAVTTKIAITWTGTEIPAVVTAPPIQAPTVAVSAPPQNARWETVDLTPYFNDKVTQIFRNEYRSPRSPFVSLEIPKQGIGAWAGHVNDTAEIDDHGLRAISSENGGRLVLPSGVPFATPGTGNAKNIVFTSQWDTYPREVVIPLNGRAKHASFLVAGSTNWMQSRFNNGELIVTYSDGTTERLALANPTTWWPIDQDYFIDDYQFRDDAPLPIRVDLRTGKVRVLNANTFKGMGRTIPGGAATVLELPIDPAKELRSVTVRTLANEVVVGLMAVSLARDAGP
jgi:hypothetical protein